MHFIVKTVVDITETNARRGQEKKTILQQANFNTMYQTIGLRVNIEPTASSIDVIDVEGIGFGTGITGKQRVWTFEFYNPYEGALTIEMLEKDFDLVPVITGLNETAMINNNVFRTNNTVDRNIVFNTRHTE